MNTNGIEYFNYRNLLINYWMGHGIKVTIIDEKNCSLFANVADRDVLISIRDNLNEVIKSMPAPKIGA